MIETERLIFHEFQPDHAGFVLELMNEPSFIRNIGDRGVRTLADALQWIENSPRANYARLGFGHYVVQLKLTGEPVGMCGLRTREGLDDPDIGYAVLERHWGNGYAMEAARAMLDYARTVLQLPRIMAICSPSNFVSVAILAKLGFRDHGTTRLPGENHDVRLFALELAVT